MATKPILYSEHALTALRERKLDREWVERTVHAPDWRLPYSGDPEVERRYGIVPERGGRVLRVAVVETVSEIRIVTVFLDRRARRP